MGEQGIQGFPTVKYGNAYSLEDYAGSRTFSKLQEFAKNLKPSCGVANIELCDDEKRKSLEELLNLSDEDLKALVDDADEILNDVETTFKQDVEKLQKAYQELQEKYTIDLSEAKPDDYMEYKAIRAMRNSAKETENEMKEEI